jgi:hypothetical protein
MGIAEASATTSVIAERAVLGAPATYAPAMTLDEIEAMLPWGLHDAYLEGLDIDWLRAGLRQTVRVMISEHQDLDRRARIALDGLVFCIIERPAPSEHASPPSPHGLWIDSIGGDVGASLPPAPAGCFVHRFYVEGWNSCILFCARSAELEWLEPAPVAARAGTRRCSARPQRCKMRSHAESNPLKQARDLGRR